MYGLQERNLILYNSFGQMKIFIYEGITELFHCKVGVYVKNSQFR